MQLDTLQVRIQDLMEEKKRMKAVIVETSVASILMALAGCPATPSVVEESNQAVDEKEAALDEIARNYATMTIENLRSQVSSEIRYRRDTYIMEKHFIQSSLRLFLATMKNLSLTNPCLRRIERVAHQKNLS